MPMRLRATAGLSAAIAALLVALPAAAHDHTVMPPPPPEAYVPGNQGGWQQSSGDYGVQRDRWLAECRRRLGDNGVGGAVIGGIVGGIAGHEIAGHHDRVLGTVAGAAVGAIAGAAIDKAEDRGRVRDQCDAMLEGYAPQLYGPAYGYPSMVMMMPITMIPAPTPVQQAAPCKETVTTREYVTYEAVRRRTIPRRPVLHDKRVKIAPDKRVISQ